LRVVAWAILLFGISLRIFMYLQNRGLIIDEANIVRNIYERDFYSLATPLNYEQFAPPVFLWILKLNSFLFGYSEYAMRLYPLFAGITSVYLLYLLSKQYMFRAAWYPLFLFATAYIFVRYSTEV